MRSDFKAILFFLCLNSTVQADEVLDLREIDRAVVASHPVFMNRIIASVGQPDDAGLIGRNQHWGQLYSVRFQYGAGRALRHAIAIRDANIESLARRAITAGLASAAADGAFPASLPDTLAGTLDPGPSDQASAAAFFLSDVCPAFLVGQAREQGLQVIGRSIRWLAMRTDLLLTRDQEAPNRLLINALAFHSCGRLIGDTEIIALADVFLGRSIDLVRPNGSFIEGDGTDTSYQAVSLVAMGDLLASGYAGQFKTEAQQTYVSAGAWLSEHIRSDGGLDSTQNTRTCADETFIGREKDIDLREVFRALAYLNVNQGTEFPRMEDFKGWLRTEPDPCN